VPSGATEFLAAVGCWRDRGLTAKRRRHGGVQRSEVTPDRQPKRKRRRPGAGQRSATRDPPSQPIRRFGRRSRCDSRTVGASLVGRKANRPSSQDSRSRIEISMRDCHFGRSRLARRSSSPGPPTVRTKVHTRDYDRGVGKGMHGLPPQPGLNRAATDGCGESKRTASALEEHRPEQSRKDHNGV
jgi:hypothetical protein